MSTRTTGTRRPPWVPTKSLTRASIARVRRAAERFDAALARFVELDRESRSDGHESPDLEPAKDATAAAWEALKTEVESTGYAAVITGGQLYFLNAGRKGLMTLPSETEHEYACQMMPARLVLNLDATGGTKS